MLQEAELALSRGSAEPQFRSMDRPRRFDGLAARSAISAVLTTATQRVELSVMDAYWDGRIG